VIGIRTKYMQVRLICRGSVVQRWLFLLAHRCRNEEISLFYAVESCEHLSRWRNDVTSSTRRDVTRPAGASSFPYCPSSPSRPAVPSGCGPFSTKGVRTVTSKLQSPRVYDNIFMAVVLKEVRGAPELSGVRRECVNRALKSSSTHYKRCLGD